MMLNVTSTSARIQVYTGISAILTEDFMVFLSLSAEFRDYISNQTTFISFHISFYLLLTTGLRLNWFLWVPRGNDCASSYATTVLQIHSLCWWLIMLSFRCMYCELLKAFKYPVNIQIWSFDVVRMKQTADRKRAVGSNSEWAAVGWNFVIVPFFHSFRTNGKSNFFLIFLQK